MVACDYDIYDTYGILKAGLQMRDWCKVLKSDDEAERGRAHPQFRNLGILPTIYTQMGEVQYIL